MNLYSRTLRHVDMNHVKKLHEEKVEQKKLEEKEKERIREELKNFNSPEFSNWRCELKEGMTSSGLFQTTLPATGDLDISAFATNSQETIDSNPTATSISDSGTGSGFSGGFDIGQEYISLDGSSYYSPAFITPSTDLSKVDTLSVTSISGNGSNGGLTPFDDLYVGFGDGNNISSLLKIGSKTSSSLSNTEIGIPKEFQKDNVQLIFFTSTTDDPTKLSRHFDKMTIPLNGLNHATVDSLTPTIGYNWANNIAVDFLIYDYNDDDDMRSAGFDWWYNVNATRFGLFSQTPDDFEGAQYIYSTWPAAPVSGATKYNEVTDDDYIYIGRFVWDYFKNTQLYGISNISFKRRTPITVFVPLDSAEAASFIRTDPIMANLSPEERKKKLQDMLDASDEYIEKILGSAFPGTGAVPPGEYDPFAQAPPGQAGDTPGVEIAVGQTQYGDVNRGLKPDGSLGEPKPGELNKGNDGKWYEYSPSGGWLPIPTVQSPENDTKIAGLPPNVYPKYDTQVAGNPATGGQPSHDSGSPGTRPSAAERDNKNMRWDPHMKIWAPNIPRVQKNKNKPMVAHHEPQGNLIIERKKKLKSPEEVLNKIPGYYDGKPAPLGFPVEKPPEMKNGMHPDLVDGKKVADRFNRLDPISAKAMPLTGNPHIDKKVKAARKNPK